MDQSLRDFVAEAEDILDNLEESISLLMDISPDDHRKPDIINAFFRHAHSLKGLSGMLNLNDLSSLSHKLESLLDSIRLDKMDLNDHVIEVLSSGVQLLIKMVRAVAGGKGDGSVSSSSFLQELEKLGSSGSTDTEGDLSFFIDVPEKLNEVLSEYEEHRFKDNIGKNIPFYRMNCSFPIETFDVQLKDITDRIKEDGELLTTLPQTESAGDGKIGFLLYFTSRKDGSSLMDKFVGEGFSCEPVRYTAREASKPAAVPSELAALEPGEAEAADSLEEEIRGVSNTVRVDIHKLDHLMNLVGELTMLGSALESINERIFSDVNKDLDSLSLDMGKNLNTIESKLLELRDGVMDIRMVPMGQLFTRLQRVSKKLARETGKKIRMEFVGSDTELDKMIMEEIVSPLLHVLRNSIDHGIEPAQERRSLGKSEEGLIRIAAYQQGSHVLLEVVDDGRGIDLARIMEHAREIGIVDGEDVLSEEEIISFLFRPGFSTKGTVSQISGRGVGMDVVKRGIEEIGGAVELNTALGKGTRIVLTLPITLAILQALMVRSGNNLYAVPMGSVQETLQIPESQIRTIEGRQVITLRDKMVPLIRLENIFQLEENGSTADEPFIVVIGIGARTMGILVNDLLGKQDVVIKPLGAAFQDAVGLAGAAELGDRSPVLVLDVTGLMVEAVRIGTLRGKV